VLLRLRLSAGTGSVAMRCSIALRNKQDSANLQATICYNTEPCSRFRRLCFRAFLRFFYTLRRFVLENFALRQQVVVPKSRLTPFGPLVCNKISPRARGPPSYGSECFWRLPSTSSRLKRVHWRIHLGEWLPRAFGRRKRITLRPSPNLRRSISRSLEASLGKLALRSPICMSEL
jgi:hypothetical protein